MSKPTSKAGPVAYFMPYLGGGGAERAALEIIRRLIRRGLEVDLIITRSGGELWNPIPEGFHMVDLKSWKILTSLPALVRYLKQRRSAVLISTLGAGNIVSLVAKKYFLRNSKLIVRHENHFSAQHKYSKFGIYPRILRWLFPVADSIVAVSKDGTEDLGKSVPRAADLVTYIPNPVVNSALFEQARSPLKHPWLDDSEVPVIIACGRLVPQKDYPTLLKAFAELRCSRIARLMILGDGSAKAVGISPPGLRSRVTPSPNPPPFQGEEIGARDRARRQAAGAVTVSSKPVRKTRQPSGGLSNATALGAWRYAGAAAWATNLRMTV